jgi:phosphotransferase system IIA component
MTTTTGLELIVHIGIDTVELEGQGFEKVASEGQLIHVGTPIVRFDRTLIESLGKSVLSPVVSTNTASKISKRAKGLVRAGQDILFIAEL